MEKEKIAIEIKAWNLKPELDNAPIKRGYQPGLYGMIDSYKAQYFKRKDLLGDEFTQLLIIDNTWFKQSTQYSPEEIKKAIVKELKIPEDLIIVLQRGENYDKLLETIDKIKK